MNVIATQSNRASRTAARAFGLFFLGLSTLSCAALAQNGTSPFGANVIVFDPSMATADIQATVDRINTQQQYNEFGTQRYSLLFKPGVYGSAAAPLIVQVGFYTEVAGLGSSPNDVTINGHVDVYNQCTANSGCIALDTFWRSVSNLTINVMGSSGCHSSADFWAVSQADPMRRVQINGGNLSLQDYCSGPGYASGGFIADSKTGFIISAGQQQFYTRNSDIGGWSNGVWNQVFTGDTGAPANTYPANAYTALASTPVSREKPFLTVDANGNYSVFAPGLRTASVGTDWAAGTAPGRSLPLSSFLVANPSTPVFEINLALALGKNLILTPGIYQYRLPIVVTRPNTVVLAMGDATLVPQAGNAAIAIADVNGVEVAGMIVDAGPVNSPVLFQVGSPNLPPFLKRIVSDPSNPITLSDVFFRVGGPALGKATTSLEINHDNTIVDDIWAWRADHGTGVGWTLNTGDHGLVVNGDNVTATGLAVEHYQKEQTLWNGNGGETIFYQSELPYDVPSQAAWMDGNANGYPSYVVANNVTSHEAYGLGIYSFFNQGVDIIEDNAMTVPNTPGVAVHDVGTIFLAGSGQITHVINGEGATVSKSNPDTLSPVVQYPQ